jgi:hypothetical protein
MANRGFKSPSGQRPTLQAPYSKWFTEWTCGGPQQIVPAALLGGSVNVNTLTFPTEVPGARRLSLG